jgi:hypothetical protein
MEQNLERIRTDLRKAAEARDEYKGKNNMDFWAQQKDEASNYLASLRARLTALTAEKKPARATDAGSIAQHDLNWIGRARFDSDSPNGGMLMQRERLKTLCFHLTS